MNNKQFALMCFLVSFAIGWIYLVVTLPMTKVIIVGVTLLAVFFAGITGELLDGG